jgi:MYXO-CTERM domain-containing protein
LNFSNIYLSQPLAGTTGHADLLFQFKVEYQLDALGLPAGNPVYSPVFNLTGTVQSAPGSFAMFNGVINYYGTVVPGPPSTLHIHQYGAVWTTPGAFTATVAGNPLGMTTPALLPFTTLVLEGWLRFTVDPATIQGSSTTIPEPGTWALAMTGAALAWVGRRRHSR